MKRYPILFFFLILIFSCGKDEYSEQQLLEEGEDMTITTRYSDDNGCSITFLGYDENGCCMYQLNYYTTPDDPVSIDSKGPGKVKYYITVDGKIIKGNTFTICDGAWVRLIKDTNQTSILLCSSYVECESNCDVDVTIGESCTADECCYSIETSGVTNHTLVINGDAQDLTSDVSLCICIGVGESLEIVLLDENGVVCFEETVTCYTCDECDQNYLTVSMTPLPPENGLECCQVIVKKEGPIYICDVGGGSKDIYEEDGITVSGIGGTPVSISYKVCREPWAETNLTAWWDIIDWSTNTQLCPRMEVDFDLEDCK